MTEHVCQSPFDSCRPRHFHQRPLGPRNNPAIDSARVRVADRRVMPCFEDAAKNVLSSEAQFFDVAEQKRSRPGRCEQSTARHGWERDAARRSAQKERRAVAALVVGKIKAVKLLPQA